MKNDESSKKNETPKSQKDSDIISQCKFVLGNIEKCKDELGLADEEMTTYLKMVENIKPQDVPKVLELALKIRESGKIKDPEVKRDASRLIRAIEMS